MTDPDVKAGQLEQIEAPESVGRIARFIDRLAARVGGGLAARATQPIGAAGLDAAAFAGAIASRSVFTGADPQWLAPLMSRYQLQASDLAQFSLWLIQWHERSDEVQAMIHPEPGMGAPGPPLAGQAAYPQEFSLVRRPRMADHDYDDADGDVAAVRARRARRARLRAEEADREEYDEAAFEQQAERRRLERFRYYEARRMGRSAAPGTGLAPSRGLSRSGVAEQGPPAERELVAERVLSAEGSAAAAATAEEEGAIAAVAGSPSACLRLLRVMPRAVWLANFGLSSFIAGLVTGQPAVAEAPAMLGGHSAAIGMAMPFFSHAPMFPQPAAALLPRAPGFAPMAAALVGGGAASAGAGGSPALAADQTLDDTFTPGSLAPGIVLMPGAASGPAGYAGAAVGGLAVHHGGILPTTPGLAAASAAGALLNRLLAVSAQKTAVGDQGAPGPGRQPGGAGGIPQVDGLQPFHPGLPGLGAGVPGAAQSPGLRAIHSAWIGLSGAFPSAGRAPGAGFAGLPKGPFGGSFTSSVGSARNFSAGGIGPAEAMAGGQTGPVGNDEAPRPELGMITLVAPPMQVASAEAEQAGIASSFNWQDLAAGAGSVDAAGLAQLSQAIPGAQAIYPALPENRLPDGAVNLPLDSSLAGTLMGTGYSASHLALASSNLASAARGGRPAAQALSGSLVPGKPPAGQAAGVLPGSTAGKHAPGGPGALAHAGAGQATGGGPMDFIGMPVRLAPSLAAHPRLADEVAVRTAATSTAPTTRPQEFAGLRKTLFPAFHSVDAEPDQAAWNKAAPSFGLRDAHPTTLLSPDSRIKPPPAGSTAAAMLSAVNSAMPGASKLPTPVLGALSPNLAPSITNAAAGSKPSLGSPSPIHPFTSPHLDASPPTHTAGSSRGGDRLIGPTSPTSIGPSIPPALRGPHEDGRPLGGSFAGPTLALSRLNPLCSSGLGGRPPLGPNLTHSDGPALTPPIGLGSQPHTGISLAAAQPSGMSGFRGGPVLRPQVPVSTSPPGPLSMDVPSPTAGPRVPASTLRPSWPVQGPRMFYAPRAPVFGRPPGGEHMTIQRATNITPAGRRPSGPAQSTHQDASGAVEAGMAATEVNLLANEVWTLLKRRLHTESERFGRW